MRAGTVLPHAVADAGSVNAGPWWLETRDGPVELGDSLPHWDYSTDLTIVRLLTLDAEAVSASCRLINGDRLACVATWRSTATGLRALAATATVEPSDAPLELRARLRGADLGGVLILETQLLLAGVSRSDHPLAPNRPGSILWRDQHAVRLEGIAGRFPVEILDLEDLGIPGASRAAWYLDWPRNRLNESAMGSVRLYINRGNEMLVEAVSQESPDARAEAVWSAVRHEVGRTLIEGALGDLEFLADPEGYEPGSMGASIRQLLRALWPGETPESLAARMRDLPDDWAAELQDRLQLFVRA